LVDALTFIPITGQPSASAVIADEPLSCANRSTDIDPGETLVLSTKVRDATLLETWRLPRNVLSEVRNFNRKFVATYFTPEFYRQKCQKKFA
jgi:hypothetical protein